MPSPVTSQTRLRERKETDRKRLKPFPETKIIPLPPPAYSLCESCKGAFLYAELRGRWGATPDHPGGGTGPTAPCSNAGAARAGPARYVYQRRGSAHPRAAGGCGSRKRPAAHAAGLARVKPTCWFITASFTTRPSCAPHWSPVGIDSTGTPTPKVLLHAFAEWGANCVPRCNGIFAFAVWQQNAGTLFLARDRCGVKPLFYTQAEDSLIFGSELKTLLAHPAVPPASTPTVWLSAAARPRAHAGLRRISKCAGAAARPVRCL